MGYISALVEDGRSAYDPMSGAIERPHEATARCQLGDVLMQDALLCQRLPAALGMGGIHPLACAFCFPSILSHPFQRLLTHKMVGKHNLPHLFLHPSLSSGKGDCA